MAKHLLRQGQYQAAWNTLLPQLDIEKKHDDVCCGIAIRAGLLLGKPKEVAPLLEHLQSLKHKNGDECHGRAAAALSAGRHAAVVKLCDTALRSTRYAPEDHDQLLYLRARALLAQGKRKEASASAARAAKLNPHHKGLAELRKKLSSR